MEHYHMKWSGLDRPVVAGHPENIPSVPWQRTLDLETSGYVCTDRQVLINSWVNRGTIVDTHAPGKTVLDEPPDLCRTRTHNHMVGSPTRTKDLDIVTRVMYFCEENVLIGKLKILLLENGNVCTNTYHCKQSKVMPERRTAYLPCSLCKLCRWYGGRRTP